MKKSVLYIVFALLLILVACGKQSDDAAGTTAPVESAALEAVETTEEEVNIPGLEDSEFDDETEATEAGETTEATEATEETKADEETEPEETTKPTEATKPTEETKPQETTPPTQPSAKPQTEYERFQNMSAEEQQAHMESFGSIEAFFDWYNNAKAEYEAANPPIDVGDGSVDMGDLLG